MARQDDGGLTTEFKATQPEAALLPPEAQDTDTGGIAVVYDARDAAPEITVESMADRVQVVRADGVAVAMVARAEGPWLKAEDVVLIERRPSR